VEVAMPKRKPREVTGFEKELVELIDAASPGRVVFTKSRPIYQGKSAYALEIATRGTTTTTVTDDLEELVQVGLEDLKSGDLIDPVTPAWSRVSRRHREVVIRTLQSIEARHMARAAKAQLGAKHSARAEYAIADAFAAALAVLWMTDDRDENGDVLPGTPQLAEGPPEAVHVAKPPKRRAKAVQ
jgi:hypothetical protein